MKYLKRFESPEWIFYNNKFIAYTERYTYTFGYINGEFIIGEETHGDLYRTVTGKFGSRYNYEYPGRVFLEQKIITLWSFPNKDKFNKIVKEISDTFGINLDDWQVEVLYDTKNNTIYKDVKDNEWDPNNLPENIEIKFIPINDYE